VSEGRSTDELVTRLVEGLEPVRPLPPVRRQMLGMAGAWALSAALAGAWLGLHPLAAIARGSVSAALVAALALVGVAGLTLAIACRIPGRERLALAGAGGVALGIVPLIVLGLGLPGSPSEAGTLVQCLDCAGRSLLLAMPAGVLSLALALRGAPWRSLAAGMGLAVGATSLGALLVHLSCPSPSAWHWLAAHALAPLGAGAGAGVLVAWILDRLGVRSRRPVAGVLDG
jgi:hypothetical protein